MAKPAKDNILKLKIDDIGAEGKGIARTDSDFVIFVNNAVPGDYVKAQVQKVKKNFAEAKLVETLEKSDYRVSPECEYFGLCNGCKMQNISYQHQLELKRKNVINSFERIGGFKEINVPIPIGSENTYFYRNKLEFSFSSQKWLTDRDFNNNDKDFALGFHMPGFVNKVLDVAKCLLQSELSNKILNLTREFFKSRRIPIYSIKSHSGYLRYLVIRQSVSTKEIMVNLITFDEKPELITEYSNFLKIEVPEVTTLVNSISKTKAQVASGEYYNTIFGKGYINENIGKFSFEITPFSFFQTNSMQAKKLFDIILEFGKFSKMENVLDLYCGTGAISIYISPYVKNVLGVEFSNEAIKTANENAKINGIDNCKFISSDVKEYLFKSSKGRFLESRFNGDETIILDPPRSGIHPKSAEYILSLEPEKIIYVSCNPATQARDIKMLAEKYKITALQPVDMFPHTFHIENVVRLDKK
jgi:23S rRNA (uracil1939-C5)-methyltransferase